MPIENSKETHFGQELLVSDQETILLPVNFKLELMHTFLEAIIRKSQFKSQYKDIAQNVVDYLINTN